jgi:hypothetical protein
LLKFQMDAGRVETGAGPGLPTRQDFEIRAQTQFSF